MKRIMKRMFSVMVILCVLLSLDATAVSAAELSGEEKEKRIEDCVNQFFCAYENVNNDKDTMEIMKEIGGLASNSGKKILASAAKPVSDVASRAVLSDEKSFINAVWYMLERRDVIQSSTDVDECEYDKKLDITLQDIRYENNRAFVEVEVDKTWHYSFSPDIESGASDIYQMSLVLVNNRYVIENISGFAEAAMDDGLAAYGEKISFDSKNAMLKEFKKQLSEEQSVRDAVLFSETIENSAQAQAAAASYSASAACSYALKYATSYNKNYASFAGEGGDCTNFTSQCLKAGGIKQHTGAPMLYTNWFYKSSSERSSTWTHAEYFRNYIQSKNSKINMPVSSWASVQNGDIVQLKKADGKAKHSLIITGVAYGASGRSDLLVCCHSPNRRHVSLKSFEAPNGRFYYHVKGNK